MRIQRLLAICSLILPSACDVTLDVYGVVGESDIYTGSTSGNVYSGKMTLTDGKGKTCTGQRRGGSDGGFGGLSCSDGMTVRIRYTTLTPFTGYGDGVASTGEKVRFTYGLNREESALYLGTAQSQSASAPGVTKRTATGTGFFITRQGHLLTNAHVIDGCRQVNVTGVDGTQQTATVVAKDKTNDIAVLQATPAPAIATLRDRPVRQGETVVAYGFPLSGLVSSGGVLTVGTVSALTGVRDDTRFLQISTQLQPGSSGGPLMDTTGSIVGVTTSSLVRAKDSSPQNVNFALKADIVRTFLASVGVAVEAGSVARELSVPAIGERARTFTLLVECRG